MKGIYRDYSCTLSERNCVKLLRALAVTKGEIASQFTQAERGKSLPTATTWFRLRFIDLKAVKAFEALEFELEKPTRLGFTIDESMGLVASV